MALKAIRSITKIIKLQFTGFGKRPWFIPGATGATFIKKKYERIPFIKKVYLPNCKLVGPYHGLEKSKDGWKVIDDTEYLEKEISDSEFVDMFNANKDKTKISH